jgi:outer membrane protein assembly factor BamB
MHSDVGHLLDGRTGETVWTRSKAAIPDVFRWGYTGVPVAIANLVGDQRDELVNLYPVCYWIADGATGELIDGHDLATRQVVPAWAAYGEPLVWDFTGDRRAEILLDSPYILALLETSGKALWHGKRRRSYPTGQTDDNLGETTSIKHALVDFDGDGRMEIASGGYRDGVRALDPVDGTILWTLAAPTPTGRKCTAADIDGNGGEELLYVAGNRLVAISGDRGRGHLLWTWQCLSPLSLPAIADLDDDSRAEIVLQSADGVVHCLDGPVR